MSYNKSSEAFEALKNYMRENHKAKLVAGGKEILKRCHFCGDSRDPSSAHMYIGMRDNAIVYNCFKCNSSGLVDGKFLRDMGCYDTNIMYLCQEQNKKASNSNSSRSGSIRSIKSRVLNIPLSNNEYALKKLQYISNRLGHQFTAYDAARFKVILNLKDFLNFNNITQYTRKPDMVDLIDKFFIGFLSIDNRYVLLRRLVPEGKLPKFIDYRYINYNIFSSDNDGIKYYAIPTIIDLTKPLDIHIAEGAFDIVSIYMHTAPLGTNGIFAAIGGKSYLSLVRYFIVNYGFTGFNLHLYPDADIDIDQMVRIKEDISCFNIKIFIHRNNFPGEKDFGVSMDKIIDSYGKI